MGELKMSDLPKRTKEKILPASEAIKMSNLPVKKEKRYHPQHVVRLEDNFPVPEASKFPPTKGNLYHILPDGIWSERRCFIIGGGPSLKGFDFSQLKGELTIAVNRAFEKLDACLMVSQDARVWGWIEQGKFGEEAKKKFESYPIKAWLNLGIAPFPEEIQLIPHSGFRDLVFSYKDGLPSSTNSGFLALNLAICLGANPIYLLGFDMNPTEDGQTKNFHSGYPDPTDANVYKELMIPTFERFAGKIEEKGIKVINLNPNSGLKCFDFDTIDSVFEKNPRKHPLFIGFYTKNTGYEEEARRLSFSLRKFGLEYELVGIEDSGDWITNDNYKLTLIENMMEKYPGRDLVYLDADAVVMKYPELFENIDQDIGIVYLDWNSINSRYDRKDYLAGTIYIKSTPGGRTFVNVWRKILNENPGWDDLQALNELLNREDNPFTVRYLPLGYCQIFDTMAAAGEPIIEQFQASRRFKRPMMEVELEEKNKYEGLWQTTYIPSKTSKVMPDYIEKFYQSKSMKMLDLGCGDGSVVRELVQRGYDCKGVDITLAGIPDNLPVYTDEGPDPRMRIEPTGLFTEAPLWRLPFKNNEFDLTFSSDVLEHIPRNLVNQVIKEIIRVTKIKTVHIVATFPDKRGDVVLHHTVESAGWWIEQFDDCRAGKLIGVKIIDRKEFMGE